MADDTRIEVSLNGETVVVDPTDIDGCEWRLVKNETGMRPKAVFESVEEMDFEALAALVWIAKRRDDPNLGYETVLSSLSLASFADNEDTEEVEDPSGQGVNSDS